MNETFSADRPNVIWILSDQLRAQALSHRGDPNVNTPNLDILAAEGVSFPNAISGTPLCTPFRGALLTGLYPHQSGVAGHNDPLPERIPTIAHTLASNGYRTCYIGKWHLDGDRPEIGLPAGKDHSRKRVIPPERRGGFQDWRGFELSNRPFDSSVNIDGEQGTLLHKLEGYQTDSLTDLLIDWLGDRKAQQEERGQTARQPFFACLSVEAPHNPYTAPPEIMAHYNPARIKLPANVPAVKAVEQQARQELAGYYAGIERLDWNVGRIRQALRKLGLSDNTYLMFFSDHGDMHGSHGQFRKTCPWEEAIRIPFIVGGPTRHHNDPKTVAYPLNHVDIAPTTLGLCGISKPAEMPGFDYYPWISDAGFADGNAASGLPDSAYLSLPKPSGHEDSIDRQFRGIVTVDGWKYVALEGQPWLLFNLNEDPFEQVNLAHNTRYRNKRDTLNERLRQWGLETNDAFAIPNLGGTP